MSITLSDTEYADKMRRWGDEMQSEASRLAEAVDFDALPYEAQMALVTVQSLVEDWAAVRLVAAESAATPADDADDHGHVITLADVEDAAREVVGRGVSVVEASEPAPHEVTVLLRIGRWTRLVDRYVMEGQLKESAGELVQARLYPVKPITLRVNVVWDDEQ